MSGSTLDIDLPFTLFQYTLPSSLGRSSRTLSDEQQGLYQWAEGVLDKYGLPGKECVLLTVCQMAQAEGGVVGSYGMVGRAVQAVFMMDNSMVDTETLVEYLQAKVLGEEKGDCEAVYPGCPISMKNLDNIVSAIGPEMMKNFL